MTPDPVELPDLIKAKMRATEAERAEQAAWFEQFNQRRGEDAEQAAYLRQWMQTHPRQARPVAWRWLGLGLAVLLLLAVWLTWAWATGPVG